MAQAQLANVKTLICDNDGVHIDSEHIAMEVMDEFGLAMVKQYDASAELESGDIYKQYVGVQTSKIVQALIDRFDLPLEAIKEDYDLGDISDNDVSGVLAVKVTEATNEAFGERLYAIRGVVPALERADALLGGKGNRFLCTTSPIDRMNISLECANDPDTGENAGLATAYPEETRVSGYHTDNKYAEFFRLHPEIDPATSVIVEDSAHGAGLAMAVGAKGVIGTVAAKFYEDKYAQAAKLREGGADIVITDMADLDKALQWLDSGLHLENKPEFSGQIWYDTSNNPPELEVKGEAKKHEFH